MYIKKLFVLFTVLIIFDRTNAREFNQQYVLLDGTQSLYKLATEAKTWLKAAKICDRDGAKLFYPENHEEAYVVLDFINRTHPEWGSIYIGVSDILIEGFFVTIDGRPLADIYYNWNDEEPSDTGYNEDCGQLDVRGKMNDVDCSVLLHYVCKKSILFTAPVRKVPEIEHDKPVITDEQEFIKHYTLIEGTQSLYKLQEGARTWTAAVEACDREGATLFIPEDRNEADAVIGFINQTRPDWGSIYIGITDNEIEGNFVTIDGRPLRDVYHSWHDGEPNDVNSNEDCVVLRLDGTMNDVICSALKYCICKKTYVNTTPKENINVAVESAKEDAEKHFFRKDYTYVKTTQSFYKVHTQRKTWLEAKRMCAREGATFFYPEDRKEANAVLGIIKQTQGYGSIIIGVSDLLAGGVFDTIDGRPIADVYNVWGKAQPDNSDRQNHCVEMVSSGILHITDCNTPMNFVCKKTLRTLKWNELCNMPNTDYKNNGQLNNCYKIHTKPMNWSQAYATCAAEQSYLAVINSQEEAEYLASLTQQAPEVPGNYIKGFVLLGFHDQFNDGWTTVKGTSLEETGYTRWAQHQPDSNGAEKYGSMIDKTGQLNDIDGVKKCYFICEHDVIRANGEALRNSNDAHLLARA